MKVRRFEPRFNQAVIDFILTIQQEEFGLDISLADQSDLHDIQSSYQEQGDFWVVTDEQEENILGCIGLVSLSGDHVALKKMFVNPECRQLGLGKKLVGSFLSYCHYHDKKAIYLGTASRFEAAQKFYHKLGFKKIESKDLPKDFPLLVVDNSYYVYSLY